MPGKIVPEQMRRVEKALIPPDAMREILVNALIHRDYSIFGGAISLAIFDDRVEIWSAGRYPTGKEVCGFAVVTFRVQVAVVPTGPITHQVTPPVTPPVIALMRILYEERVLGAADIRNRLGLKDRTHVRDHYLIPALESEMVELTLPGKPNSRLQAYRLTDLGREVFTKLKNKGSE